MPLKQYMRKQQLGLSLVELMVGLVIGLVTTLVIMQIFSTFEGQKRSTMGSADAQTNGSIALFTIQRDLQMAGFGLPVFNKQNPPLKCNPTVTVDHDGNAATPAIDMFPISITDGGGGLSDVIQVRYSEDGPNSKAGVAIAVDSLLGSNAIVENNLGCNGTDHVDSNTGVGDVVMISSGATCNMTRVNNTDAYLAANPQHIPLASTAGVVNGASISCMGAWNQFTYTVVNNQLQRNVASQVNAMPLVSDIVNIQAQYGIADTASSNKVTSWVSATSPWDAPTVDQRNRIRAMRVAVVARNGQLEKTNVTAAAPLAWPDLNGSPAPTIDLSADADWQRYRYRVYETIIPLRNMIWSSNTLL